MKKFIFGFIELPIDMKKHQIERILKHSFEDNGILIHYDLIDIMLKPEFADQVKNIKRPKLLNDKFVVPKLSRWQRFKLKLFGSSVVVEGDLYGFDKI